MLNYSNIKVGKWDLTDLVDDSLRTKYDRLVENIKRKVEEFENNRVILKRDLGITIFEGLLNKIESILEDLSIVNSFAQLKYAADTSSNEAASLVLQTEKLSSEISNKILFFDLWFKKELDENNAQRLIESTSPVYREFLKYKRLLARYSLNESE